MCVCVCVCARVRMPACAHHHVDCTSGPPSSESCKCCRLGPMQRPWGAHSRCAPLPGPVLWGVRPRALCRICSAVDLLCGSALGLSDDVVYTGLCRLSLHILVPGCGPLALTPSVLLLSRLACPTSASANERNCVTPAVCTSAPATCYLWLPVAEASFSSKIPCRAFPEVMAWIRAFAPFGASVAACRHSLDADKRWLFWSNRPCVAALASTCPHLPGFHKFFRNSRQPDGSWSTRLTATYPQSLAEAIAALRVPFLSVQNTVYT